MLVLDVNKRVVEVKTELTPEEVWCLLVTKNYGSNCFMTIEEDSEGRPKATPYLKIEQTAMPSEAAEDMEFISKNLVELAEKQLRFDKDWEEYDKIKKSIMDLACQKNRTTEGNNILREMRKDKNIKEKVLAWQSFHINEHERLIADLRIGWQKRNGTY